MFITANLKRFPTKFLKDLSTLQSFVPLETILAAIIRPVSRSFFDAREQLYIPHSVTALLQMEYQSVNANIRMRCSCAVIYPTQCHCTAAGGVPDCKY